MFISYIPYFNSLYKTWGKKCQIQKNSHHVQDLIPMGELWKKNYVFCPQSVARKIELVGENITVVAKNSGGIQLFKF